ncbi:hypothetical protein HF072_11390 [Bacillus sp. RO3]|nr:hypothetical protein [Bacillus sp. RO3]
MKKIVSLIVMMMVYFSFGTSVVGASDDGDYQEVLEEIEKTNQEIDKKVKEAVEKADELNRKFLAVVRGLEEGKEIQNLKKDKEEAEKELKLSSDEKKVSKLKDKVSQLDAKITKKLKERSDKLEKITAEYNEELDDIIHKVYEETLEMSQEMIEEAKEEGVMAECSWKHVRFADRWVWIDPIRVVGFYKG